MHIGKQLADLLQLADARFRLSEGNTIAFVLSEDEEHECQLRMLAKRMRDGSFAFVHQERYPNNARAVPTIDPATGRRYAEAQWTAWMDMPREHVGAVNNLTIPELLQFVHAVEQYAAGEDMPEVYDSHCAGSVTGLVIK